MTTLENLETKTPAEIDTVWADLFTEAMKTAARLKSATVTLKKYEAYGMAKDHHRESVEKAQTKHDAEVKKAQAQEAPFRAEYDRRGGWSRFTIVAGGHVHKYQGCSSLRWTTLVFWTPEHSGKTEAELVASIDAVACTKCFPSAPVATRDALKPGQCPGSRAFAGDLKMHGNYAFCPSCGVAQTVSQRTYRIRAHKAPK